jgi:citrate synthase
MEPWRTAIVDSRDGQIRYRGYDAVALMTGRTFTDTIFLLHQGRLPSVGERALLDAILTGVADHGAGAPSCAAARLALSGNRQSVSAAVAAGILAVGDDHGGAGMGCMEMIGAAVARMRAEGLSVEAAAALWADEARRERKRLAGLGHRVHHVDPRTAVLFDMAHKAGVAGAGVRFMQALEKAAAERIKPLPINIDGALAALLYDMQFPPVFGRLLFIIGRVAGLTAEVAEELARERPMRIRIPVEYDGEPAKSLDA